MNLPAKTFKDIQSDSEVGDFFGRDDELRRFREIVNSLETPRLLNVFGVGGIGKTALLRRWLWICQEENIPCAIVDLRIQRGHILDFLQEFRCQLSHLEIESEVFKAYDKTLRRFYKAYSKLRSRLPERESLATSVGGEAVVATSSAATGAFLGSLIWPGPGTIVGAGFGAAGGRAFMNTLGGRAVQSLIRSGLSPSDAEFIVSAEENLTHAMVEAIASICTQSGLIVMMVDTYEEVPSALDEWVRELFVPKLPQEAIFVIAGRESLIVQEPQWREKSQVLKCIPLEPFSKTEATTYLESRGIVAPDIITRLLAFTECLPWALAIVFDLQREGVDITREDFFRGKYQYQVGQRIVERFFAQVSETEFAPVIEICAVARRFDMDLLNEFFDAAIAREHFKRVQKYSFVRPMNDGSLALHDLVRTFMLRMLSARSPLVVDELNARLREFYVRKLSRASNHDLRKRAAVESIYHSLSANEHEGMRVFRELFSRLDFFWDFDLRDALLSEVIHAAFNSPTNRNWQSYCRAYQFVNRGQWEPAERVLNELLTSAPGPGRVLEALILDTLGVIHTGQGKYSVAVTAYERSAKLKRLSGTDLSIPGLPDTLSKLSEGYAILGRYSAAVRSAQENISICNPSGDSLGEAWARKSLGDTYRLWGKPELAISNLERAVTICDEHDDLYGLAVVRTQLARVYTHIGFWKKAEQLLNYSLEIFENLGIEYGRANCILFMGNISRFRSEFKHAEKLYRRALDLHRPMKSQREIGPALGSLGFVLFRQGRFDEALIVLQESLRIKTSQQYTRGVAVTETFLGDLHSARGDFQRALSYYASAVKNADSSQSNYHRAHSRIRYATAYIEVGESRLAKELATQGKRIAQRFGYPHEIARASITLSKIAIAELAQKSALRLILSACAKAISYNPYILSEVLHEAAAISQRVDVRQRTSFKTSLVAMLRTDLAILTAITAEQAGRRREDVPDDIPDLSRWCESLLGV